MSLRDWQQNGWLKPHQPTRPEIAGLLALAERDLKSAKVKGLDQDWRFNIAYNAALQASTAALVASGYKVPKGDSHHFRVIGSLAFTVGLDERQVAKLDAYRKSGSIPAGAEKAAGAGPNGANVVYVGKTDEMVAKFKAANNL